MQRAEYPPSPWRLVWVILGGLAAGALVALLTLTVANAGTVDVKWNQTADCQVVSGWELLMAPITTANPNPPVTSAAVGVSIPTTGLVCGMNMQKLGQAVNGVGQTRFWLRAVAIGGAKSAESNSVDVSVPLGPPSGLTVSVP